MAGEHRGGARPFLRERLRSSPQLRAEVEAARAWRVPRSAFLAWSDEDRGWAMALLAEEAEACPGCGLPRSETHDPKHEFAYKATPARCHACAAVSRAADAMKQDAAGLTYRIERRG